MEYKLLSKRLQTRTEYKTRSNAFRSCFWRTSLLHPTQWRTQKISEGGKFLSQPC